MKRLTKTYSKGFITLDAEMFHQTQETIDSEIRNSEAFTEAVRRLKEFEEKQIPKKAIIDIYGDETFSYICNCGAEVEQNQRFCDSCGQALDWSEE